jgi:hypothetical protein
MGYFRSYTHVSHPRHGHRMQPPHEVRELRVSSRTCRSATETKQLRSREEEANCEVNCLRDVGDEDRLFRIVDEESQCARRRIEVSLQLHHGSFFIGRVSFRPQIAAMHRSVRPTLHSRNSQTEDTKGSRYDVRPVAD